MGTAASPYLQGNNGLVLAIDMADAKNSYKGINKTNILTGVNYQYPNTNTATFKITNYTNIQTVPYLGTTTVYNVDAYNDYNGGSGNCCPSLFNYGTGLAVSGNTLYTYSIIYKSLTGYTHPNFMYRYEYGPSGLLTEAGVFNASNQTYLGDGWYHAWGSFTTNPSTTYINTYFFEYEYATYNTFSIAAAMIVQGNFIIPPTQFIPFSTTRSSTQGLLDMTGNNIISLANAVFDSNAQIYFDGNSSYLSVTNNSSLKNDFTSIEFVIKYTNTPYGDIIQFGVGSGTYAQYYYRAYSGNSYWNWYPSTGGNGNITIPNAAFTLNKFYHVVMTGDSFGYVQFYINGVIQSGVSSTYPTTPTPLVWTPNNLTIGGYSWDGYSSSVIQLVRIYNRVLNSAEINFNYNSLKSRFGF